MTDWLAELREEKNQAIARTQAARAAAPQYASPAERLRAEEQQLGALIHQIGIEPLLQQFVDEVLRDHPLFADSTLNRTVTGRDPEAGPGHEAKEGEPWSGPIAGNFLPAALEPGGGRSACRVDWRLHLSYRPRHGEQLQLNDILITALPRSVQVNHETLAEPTAEKFKTALVSAFRDSTQLSAAAGSRRTRRKRRRYTRLKDKLFPANQPTRLYIAMVILAVIVLVVVISMLSAALGVAPAN